MDTGQESADTTRVPTDTELLDLFRRQPGRAWRLFLDRYADFILTQLRRSGLDHDPAMDGFVYICEKLSENGFRRLKSVRYAGDRGDLTPWLRTVIKNLSTNWTWSREGRKRLLKSIGALPPLEQRVFQLYFWQGMSPSDVWQQLRREGAGDLAQVAVYDALEAVFGHLSQKKLWHLIGGLTRQRTPLSLDSAPPERAPPEPRASGPDPEQELLGRELSVGLQEALRELPARQRLLLQFRFEDTLSLREIGQLLKLSRAEVAAQLRSVIDDLRRRIELPAAGSVTAARGGG